MSLSAHNPVLVAPDNAKEERSGRRDAVRRAVMVWPQGKAPRDNAKSWWFAKAIGGVVLGVVSASAWGLAGGIVGVVLPVAAAIVAQIFIGWPCYRVLLEGWRAHQSKIPLALASLMSFTAGVIAAFNPEFFHGASPLDASPWLAMVLALAFSREADAEEVLAEDRTYLAGLRVQTACLKGVSGEIPTAVDTLKVGDTVLVRAGEKIPRDGVILKGTTSVDEAMFTGETRPLHKETGRSVVGGSINRDADIVVEVKGARAEDVLERMIRKVDDCLSGKPVGVMRGATAALTLAHVAVVFAFAVGLARYFLGHGVGYALLAGTAVLSAVGPGLQLLGLSGYRGLTGSAMMRGIYFSSPKAVDALSRVKALFFNKTGTLTVGNFVYSQYFIEPGTNQGEFFSTLFSLEQASGHPLGRSSATHPWFLDVPKNPVRELQIHPGLGVSGIICRRGFKEYFAAVGNLRFVKRMRFNVSREMRAMIDDLEDMGETVVLCGYGRGVHGIVSFADTLRKNVRRTLRRIQSLGIETALVTGDTEKTVTQLTGTLGIEKIHSRCTPEEKAQKIAKEKEGGRTVAVVDCDVADNPVMHSADVSLSMDCGTAIADHPADVLLTGSDFSLLHWLLMTLRQTAQRVSLSLGAGGALVAITALLASLGLGNIVMIALANAVLTYFSSAWIMRVALDEESVSNP